ncbi:MAG: CPBP family intramembrane glutamic endopeptidase [Gemmatimonadota bacterium]
MVESLAMGIATIAVVALLLLLAGEGPGHLGFSARPMGRQLGFGVLFGLLIWIFDTFVSSPVVGALLPEDSAKGVDMSRLFTDLRLLPLWTLAGLLKGGFSEELWRIFGLTRFEKWLGRPGLVLALVLGSVVFGFGHLYQGARGLVTTELVGLLYALVYLRRRRALEAVFAHSTFNLVSIALGYALYHGQ